ncbi:sigma-70 family RNA polymerase sigma factor [Candidatus Pacearchaeota archaeon]|nr:sigma-70 family RNA polymerase sigma factor [Candidatus Pacearchaeota archaeon]
MVSFSDYFVDLVNELEKSKDTLIRGVQLRLGISYCDAEDCFQNAYVGLVQSSIDGRLDSDRSGRGYFCESLRNACLDFLRLKRKMPVNLEDASSFPGSSKGPSDEAVLHEDLERYERAVASMPCSCYDAFKLYVVDGLSREEVAQRLGLRLNAVSVRVHRAEKFLMKKMTV